MNDRAAKRRPTIYDISRDAEASPATVSLVLNGKWENHRISPELAERVQQTARHLGYRVNKQARGLRLARSGLAGMIIPHYRNRFFGGLAECFEAKARSMGLCPIVVSTQRDREIEARFVRTLLDQQIEFLFLAGISNPTSLNLACREAQAACVNIDLPGDAAPSVVTDNRFAAKTLTQALLSQVGESNGRKLLFFGGVPGEFATEERVAGFAEAIADTGHRMPPNAVLRCGYSPVTSRLALRGRLTKSRTRPSGIFVNSITAFEGLIQLRTSEPDLLPLDLPLGCFDWDPFAAHLPGRITMLQQDVNGIIDAAFALLDSPAQTPPQTVVIPAAFATSGVDQEYHTDVSGNGSGGERWQPMT